jgi:hypothetical protein
MTTFECVIQVRTPGLGISGDARASSCATPLELDYVAACREVFEGIQRDLESQAKIRSEKQNG